MTDDRIFLNSLCHFTVRRGEFWLALHGGALHHSLVTQVARTAALRSRDPRWIPLCPKPHFSHTALSIVSLAFIPASSPISCVPTHSGALETSLSCTFRPNSLIYPDISVMPTERRARVRSACRHPQSVFLFPLAALSLKHCFACPFISAAWAGLLTE